MPDALAPVDIPIGSIQEWSGTLASIPFGWHLCDGTWGTPDLHATFLRGAVAGHEAGTTGGEDTHVLLTSEMPSHNHSFSNTAHTHTIGRHRQVGNNSGIVRTSATPSTDSQPSGISINNAGSGTAHENRPAFLELAYIQKVQ